MIAENEIRHGGNSRVNQSVCQVCGSISLHRLGTFGKSLGTFVSRSTCPLAQVISRDSILARFPLTKMNPWIISRHIAHAALGLFDARRFSEVSFSEEPIPWRLDFVPINRTSSQ